MTQLVGIVNVTPDSFSDGGDYFDTKDAISRVKQLFQEGASMVDIGAESTRPGAEALTAQQEWLRLEPVLKVVLPLYLGKILLDSYHPETVRQAYALAPVIVNDVTGMNNPAMVALVAELEPTTIICHLPGTDIQAAHQHANISSVDRVKQDLLAKAKLLEDNGLARNKIILDPGIGFGKTAQLNKLLLDFAKEVPDYRVMIGYSRKRFLGEGRMNLEINLKAGRQAVASGAAYLRVHDVAGHAALIKEKP